MRPLRLPSGRAEPLSDNLRPAAGSRAEIDNDHPGTQQPVLVGDFGKLIGGSRTKTLGHRSLDVRIVDVTCNPLGVRAVLATNGRHVYERQRESQPDGYEPASLT